MKRIFFAVTIFIVVAFVYSCEKGSDNNNNSLNSTDQNFINMAAFSSNAEIDLARLALTQSGNDSIKMFAQTMITDHTMASGQLDSLASRYNVTLPTTLDSAHTALKDTLTGLSGTVFDSAYIKGQVNDHIAAIALFNNEVNTGNNADVKNFASSKLPVLQMHLQMADTLAQDVH
jgi:putative membrane protein